MAGRHLRYLYTNAGKRLRQANTSVFLVPGVRFSRPSPHVVLA